MGEIPSQPPSSSLSLFLLDFTSGEGVERRLAVLVSDMYVLHSYCNNEMRWRICSCSQCKMLQAHNFATIFALRSLFALFALFSSAFGSAQLCCIMASVLQFLLLLSSLILLFALFVMQ